MGQQLLHLSIIDCKSRYQLEKQDTSDSKQGTFVDTDPTMLELIFTGTVGSSLKEGGWILTTTETCILERTS